MSDMVRTLENELLILDAEIEKLTKHAEAIRSTIEYLRIKEGAAPQRISIRLSTAAPANKPTAGIQARLLKGITEILKERGSAMHRKDILLALKERGIDVPGKRPINNMSAHLSHKPNVFKPTGNGYWALREWDDAQPSLRE